MKLLSESKEQCLFYCYIPKVLITDTYVRLNKYLLIDGLIALFHMADSSSGYNLSLLTFRFSAFLTTLSCLGSHLKIIIAFSFRKQEIKALRD